LGKFGKRANALNSALSGGTEGAKLKTQNSKRKNIVSLRDILFYKAMSIISKENIISKGKTAAKHTAMLSFGIFLFSFLAGFFVTNGWAVNTLGNISVFSVLFFALSIVSLFLIQIESWEEDLA